MITSKRKRHSEEFKTKVASEGLLGVRDGLRRIFAKIGARSRTEMIARILRIECPERIDATETRRLHP